MYHIVRFVQDETLAVVCDCWMVDRRHVRWAFRSKTEAYRKMLWHQNAVPETLPIFEVEILSSSGKIFKDKNYLRF